MAQLFYRYGAMNSGKSIELLKVAHNYQEQGKGVLLLTSALDNRSGVGTIASRIGISAPAVPVSADTDIYELVLTEYPDVNCILVDEAQFLSEINVVDLANVVDFFDIPVICFGLKNDFANNLFEGSKALLTFADKVEELKTICQYCQKKAIMNLRFVNDKPVYEGEQVQIGDEEYVSVCRKHYYEPPINKEG